MPKAILMADGRLLDRDRAVRAKTQGPGAAEKTNKAAARAQMVSRLMGSFLESLP
jgi:hypothetical protein